MCTDGYEQCYLTTSFPLQRSAIIEEARSTGNEHVVLFLEQYFAIADVRFTCVLPKLPYSGTFSPGVNFRQFRQSVLVAKI